MNFTIYLRVKTVFYNKLSQNVFFTLFSGYGISFDVTLLNFEKVNTENILLNYRVSLISTTRTLFSQPLSSEGALFGETTISEPVSGNSNISG